MNVFFLVALSVALSSTLQVVSGRPVLFAFRVVGCSFCVRRRLAVGPGDRDDVGAGEDAASQPKSSRGLFGARLARTL